MNSSGRIVGMHVGGREKTGDSNMYDHPALATALKMICDRERGAALAACSTSTADTQADGSHSVTPLA